MRVRHSIGLSALLFLSSWLAVASDSLSVNQTSVTLPAGGAGQGKESDNSTIVTNNGTTNTNLGFNYGYQSGQPTGWLKASASPSNILANGGTSTITITGDPSKLNPGTYTGFITVTGTNSHTATITVTFETEGTTVSASPYPSVSFGPVSRQKLQQKVTLTSPSASASITAATNQGSGWLSTDAPGGAINVNGSATFNINVDATALTAGNYSGTVAVQYNGTGSPFVEVDIAVSLSIPALSSAESSTLSFTAAAGTNPVNQSFTVTNYTASAAPLTITPAGDSWLPAPTASPSTVPANGGQSTITVSISSVQLPPQASPYQSSFTVSGGGGTLTYQVTLSVNGVTIQVTQPPPGTMTASAGGKASTPLTVTSNGSPTFQVTATSNPQWLSSAPTTSATGMFTITADATSLAPGQYFGKLTVGCLGAPACLAVIFNITLNVSGAGPVITSVTNDASFTNFLAPGSAAAIFGTNLGASATSGAMVGSTSAQVTLASAAEWIVIIPANASTGATTIQVGASTAFPITVSQYAPALFSADGSGQGAILAQRVLAGSTPAVTATAPALPGDTIDIYATGLGVVDSNGHPTPQLPTVTASNQAATVVSATAQSSAPGTYLVTIQLPGSIVSGNASVFLSIGGVNSQTLTLPVGASSGPVISAVGTVTGLSEIAPNTYVSIYGSNLSTVSDPWDSHISNGQLPTQIDGVTVTIGGKPAYVQYVSSGQINVLTPPDLGLGSVGVQVTNSNGVSALFNVTSQQYAPGFFPWANNQPVATHPADYTDAMKNGTYSGLTTVPAAPGEYIIFWGSGFGPTSPAAPVGTAVPNNGTTYYVTNAPTLTLNNQPMTYYATALAPLFAGLYQVVAQIPSSMPNGDWPLVATVGGISSPTGVVLTVHN